MASDKSVNEWLAEVRTVFTEVKDQTLKAKTHDGKQVIERGNKDVLPLLLRPEMDYVSPFIRGSSLFDANGFLITPDRVVGSRKRK